MVDGINTEKHLLVMLFPATTPKNILLQKYGSALVYHTEIHVGCAKDMHMNLSIRIKQRTSTLMMTNQQEAITYTRNSSRFLLYLQRFPRLTPFPTQANNRLIARQE